MSFKLVLPKIWPTYSIFCNTMKYAKNTNAKYKTYRSESRSKGFYTPDLSGRIIMVWHWHLSVCPSVCGSVHKACKHDTDWTVSVRTFKLGTHITYDKRMNPIDFQGHMSKVKVTRYTLLFNLVNTIQTEPFQLGPSNLVHILLMTRGQNLLIFKVMGQRSQATHCFLTL